MAQPSESVLHVQYGWGELNDAHQFAYIAHSSAILNGVIFASYFSDSEEYRNLI